MPRFSHLPGSLPVEATSFVGRRHELAEARKKLAAASLVSLVGPGGGKTCLAVRIATALGRGFPDGAWLVELAELQDPALPAAAATSAHGSAGVLRQRETDVARLVAEGLSNREIGARLFISQRTVESHVRNIMNKLGFNSRAQIAGWIATSEC